MSKPDGSRDRTSKRAEKTPKAGQAIWTFCTGVSLYEFFIKYMPARISASHKIEIITDR
jgi:hypothetical protein